MPARISFYRPTGQSRRSARSIQQDEVLEGLPIRRWSCEWVSVGRPSNAPAPPPELPMPKEASLLTPTSQAFLQAARSGSQGKKEPPPQQPHPAQKLFLTKRWMQIPRHMEPPEPIYLANTPASDVSRKGLDGTALGLQQSVVVTKRRAPPPPKKKNKPRGRRPGFKKTVTFQEQGTSIADVLVNDDVDMADVDVATKDNSVSHNSVAKEIEEVEVETEKTTLKINEMSTSDAHIFSLGTEHPASFGVATK